MKCIGTGVWLGIITPEYESATHMTDIIVHRSGRERQRADDAPQGQEPDGCGTRCHPRTLALKRPHGRGRPLAQGIGGTPVLE